MSFRTTERYLKLIDQIDTINKEDPLSATDGQYEYPKEFLYSKRMSSMLNGVAPKAGELLHIAARGQHIKRWSIQRSEFPDDRQGYHQWRRKLTDLHCELLTQLMTENGYSKDETTAVENMLRKKDLKNNPDAQLLQDIVSLVFLSYYSVEFVAQHADKDITEILAKVLKKMSPKAIGISKEICPAAIVEAIKSIS